ncbi:hypothetical protein DFJ74DRAFT_686515 [Hyaloraphidium curvatum]|nr:hypothetical protein DFJ74DRAFT_686515 [Hyaloraphidium curvatum]
MIPFLWIAGIPHGFGRKQLAATTAVLVWECLVYSFLATNIGWFVGRRGAQRSAPQTDKTRAVPGGFLVVATLDSWPESAFWRYFLLRQSEDPILPRQSDDPAMLQRKLTGQLFLEHDERGGSDCCCPRKSCAGSLASHAGVVRTVNLCVVLTALMFMYVARFFTVFVTLGGQMWTSAWAVAGVILILLCFNNEPPSMFGGSNFTDNLAARELERRLEFRAVHRSLEALVAHFRSLVQGSCKDAVASCETWYSSLVPLLAVCDMDGAPGHGRRADHGFGVPGIVRKGRMDRRGASGT